MSGNNPPTTLDKFFQTGIEGDGGAVACTAGALNFVGFGVTDDPDNGVTIVANNSSGAGQTTNTLTNGLNSNIATSSLPTLRFGGPTAAYSIGGFTAASAGSVLVVVNTTSQPMTVVHEDASSTAANRIATQNGLPVTIPVGGKGSSSFVYDGTTQRWVLQGIGYDYPLVYHVRNFGAVGDGSTDDHAALTAAANAAAVNGGRVHFPPGTFKVAAPVTFPANVTCHFDEAASLAPTGAGVTINGHVSAHPNQPIFAGTGHLSSVAQTGAGGAVTASGTPTANYSVTARVWTPATALASSISLPQATISVASTLGFPTSGSFTVATTSGTEAVAYTGKTPTTFTGCTGGTGTAASGAVTLVSTSLAFGVAGFQYSLDGVAFSQPTQIFSSVKIPSSGLTLAFATASYTTGTTYTFTATAPVSLTGKAFERLNVRNFGAIPDSSFGGVGDTMLAAAIQIDPSRALWTHCAAGKSISPMRTTGRTISRTP